MIRHYFTPVVFHFWASPHESLAIIANWGAVHWERNALAIQTIRPNQANLERNDFPEQPQPHTLPEFPTDVPVPEPHDVPVPDPMDPPVPDPGRSPAGKSLQQPEREPRTVP